MNTKNISLAYAVPSLWAIHRAMEQIETNKGSYTKFNKLIKEFIKNEHMAKRTLLARHIQRFIKQYPSNKEYFKSKIRELRYG